MRIPRRRKSIDLLDKPIGDTGDMCSSSVSYGQGGISIVAARSLAPRASGFGMLRGDTGETLDEDDGRRSGFVPTSSSNTFDRFLRVVILPEKLLKRSWRGLTGDGGMLGVIGRVTVMIVGSCPVAKGSERRNAALAGGQIVDADMTLEFHRGDDTSESLESRLDL